MARLGPTLSTKHSPRKCLCGSPFCVLSKAMRHIHFFFSGAQMGCFGWGLKSLHRKMYVVFCRYLNENANRMPGLIWQILSSFGNKHRIDLANITLTMQASASQTALQDSCAFLQPNAASEARTSTCRKVPEDFRGQESSPERIEARICLSRVYPQTEQPPFLRNMRRKSISNPSKVLHYLNG